MISLSEISLDASWKESSESFSGSSFEDSHDILWPDNPKSPQTSEDSFFHVKNYCSSFEEVKTSYSDTGSNCDLAEEATVKVESKSKSGKDRDFINWRISDKILEINGKTPNGAYLDLSSLSLINEAIIDLTEFSFIEDQTKQLALVLKRLKNVRALELIIRNKNQAFSIQQQFDEIFSRLRGLRSVKFDFYRSGVASESSDYLSKEIIPKLRSLKSFHINLYDSDVTNENIQKLAWSLKKRLGQLEDFKCNVAQTKVTEKAIIQFFHEMPKMKHFELNIGNCTWQDYGMIIFIRNTLKSMKVLEKFTFLLEATDAMSVQIIDLFRNLPETLKKLRLDLRWTRATSESLKVFTEEKLPNLTALEEIELKVDCTLASKKMKEQIDRINKEFMKKIDIEECKRYQQMVKEKYST